MLQDAGENYRADSALLILFLSASPNYSTYLVTFCPPLPISAFLKAIIFLKIFILRSVTFFLRKWTVFY